MKQTLLFVFLFFAPLPAIGSEATESAKEAEAIRKNIAQYVEAYNQQDAKTLADSWSRDGEWITPEGRRIRGREAIKSELVASLTDNPEKTTLVLSNVNIRFLTPTVAIEEGTARVQHAAETAEETTYMAIHVKENGQWKLNTVRETAVPVPASHYEYLKPLQWMIGTWVDQDDDAVITTTCRWTKNKNFMTRSFSVNIGNHVELEGTQVIGYDPVNKQVRSWTFDTDGGIGTGQWRQNGAKWTIKTKYVLPDAQIGSSVSVIEQIDANTMQWQSTGREVGGKLLPDIAPVTIVRK